MLTELHDLIGALNLTVSISFTRCLLGLDLNALGLGEVLGVQGRSILVHRYHWKQRLVLVRLLDVLRRLGRTALILCLLLVPRL